ncbi:MAG: aminofutalosine synthase MqnE [Archaeoglobales archaeon]|nr:MAG: aminofutalosine synthase MqnE [Archaeoglobales archaeon]
MRVREIEDLFRMDVHELGEIANSMNDDRVMFVINRHINYTNFCVSRCPLCAFWRENGYLMSKDEVLKKVHEAVCRGATEVHIVGSHNPNVSVEYFEDIFREIKFRYPNVTIKALTATEIHFLAKIERCSVVEILSRLKDSGLEVLPGGGAEILCNDVRRLICPRKAKAEEWLNVMKIAHKLGLKSNATMLFGHIESYRHRAIHLYKLWKLQEKTKGFISFIPLVFHPKNTMLESLVKDRTNPIDILKTIAISRIVLSNFKSIRAYWVGLGEKLTQIALNYGANDVDGTIMEERVTHSAGADSPTFMTVDRIVNLIRGAGKVPVQRDTFCRVLKVYGC